jgi:hypothetical protein
MRHFAAFLTTETWQSHSAAADTIRRRRKDIPGKL